MAIILTVASLFFAAPPALTSSLRELDEIAETPFPRESQIERAKKLMALLDRDYPHEPATLYWSGVFANRRDDLSGAEAAWSKAVAAPAGGEDGLSATYRARAAERLGHLRLGSNDLSAAEALAMKAIEADPTDASGYALLALVALRTGKLEPVIARLAPLAKGDTADRAALRQLYLELLAETGGWDAIAATLNRRPPGTSGVDEHFRARLAEAAGDARSALVHHALADLLAPVGERTARLSREAVARAVATSPELLAPSARPLVELLKLDRPTEANEALGRAKSFTPRDGAEERLIGLLGARALADLDRLADAEVAYRRVVERFPDFAPARVGLGEVLEAAGKREDADRHYAAALAIAPRAGCVRLIDRLGARLSPTKLGVMLGPITRGSPWDEFGMHGGEEIVALDGERIADLSPFRRLRRVRRFQGGEVGYRANGADVVGDMELVLFPE